MMQNEKHQQSSDTLLKSTRNHLYSSIVGSNALRLLWIVIVIWGELGVFFWSLRDCHWPLLDATRESSVKPTHVLLLADTQVQHPLLQSRGQSWATMVQRFFLDLTLKKSWHVTSRLQPHAVIFLGDMLANGKSARTEESYKKTVDKFKSIFEIDQFFPSYYVVGNNDVGMGEITPLAKTVRKYFSNAFGLLSHSFEIQNHTFVALDAPGVVDEDYHRAGRGTSFTKWKPVPDGPVAFVKQLSVTRTEQDRVDSPLILLSHIPMSRPETASCGPLREKGTIRRDVGHGYQSMLGPQTTAFLLRNMQPAAIFSGDNRDYCVYNHTITDDIHTIREVTLKSFSPSVHIRHPGFQLLSLVSPSSRVFPTQKTFADTPCFLPDQSKIFTSLYLPCFLFTIILSLIVNIRRAKSHLRKPVPIRLGVFSPSLPRTINDHGSPSSHQLFHDDPLAWTPTWSPYTPPVPTSPRGTLPTTLRTPHNAHALPGPAMHASSRPGTPIIGMGPKSPFAFTSEGGLGDEDEDAMRPVQYAVRREGHRHYEEHDKEWSDIGKGKGEDSEYEFVGDMDTDTALLQPAFANTGGRASPSLLPHFISAPAATKRGRTTSWSWSWAFVLAGRRRRITLKPPTLVALKDLLGLLQTPNSGRHRTGIVQSTLVDTINTLWPSLVVWLIIIWSLL